MTKKMKNEVAAPQEEVVKTYEADLEGKYILPFTQAAIDAGDTFTASGARFEGSLLEATLARAVCEPGSSVPSVLKAVRGAFGTRLEGRAKSTLSAYTSAIAWKLDAETIGAVRRFIGEPGKHTPEVFAALIKSEAAKQGAIWSAYVSAKKAERDAKKAAEDAVDAGKLAQTEAQAKLEAEAEAEAEPEAEAEAEPAAMDAEEAVKVALTGIARLIELGDVMRLQALQEALATEIAKLSPAPLALAS
jgi:hypothetical protein